MRRVLARLGICADQRAGTTTALRIAALAATTLIASAGVAAAATRIEGQVQASGSAVGGASVTLWAAGAQSPTRLAEVRSTADGRFVVAVQRVPAGASLYLVASGGEAATNRTGRPNPAIGLMAVLGAAPPARVVVNEFTTIASVWTHAQFIEGTAIRGHALGLRIAAGNVPNFVDLRTGGWGATIQDPLNSSQTPTMANFATLANVMAGCATRVKVDACSSFFAAATPPAGAAPADTLAAAQAIARNPGHEPARVFALLNDFYPVPPASRGLRATPFLPYLSRAPSAWVMPLRFAGGGYIGGARVAFDAEGNAWSGANFIVGSQGGDALWNGNLSRFAPNGRATSPPTTGFVGGGLQGPGFGTAIDRNGRVWINSTSGRTMSLFDRNGRPISPPQGYDMGGRLGFMQGVMVTPGGDVWALDFTNDRVVFMPQGDPGRARFFCEATDSRPNRESPCRLNGPFHLVIDQQDRIWISNAIGDTVTRFPASDPSRVEVFPAGGHSGKGMAVDSRGNVWVTNTLGAGLSIETRLHLLYLKETGASLSTIDQVVLRQLLDNPGMGSVSVLRPDGTPLPGSPYNPTRSIWGAWAVSIDGNDNAWVSNFAPGGGITQICGVRTETCPPGARTGDAISPAGGYVGGGMQMLVDVSIDPAGNLWASNNWQDPTACYGSGPERDSTRCGGQGMTVFYGMAAPVRTPLIGPVQRP
ncbi:hypothetical protein Rmf_03770 [Roseomonas fluvialis]|uniref:Uncharacterized protein n=1 Tax=Roseomonas fluvialis TaxID=1750527 RepID=A0ABM7XYA3_9PROT|nr:hypothetical protein Rmf_03770 [Roseomonas fluvialis]